MLIGVGSDIVSVPRISKIVSRRPGFANRILSGKEKSIYLERRCSAEFLAGRFAAKEALLKAFGTGLRNGLLFNEIEITSGPSGEPVAGFSGRALQIFQGLGAGKAFVTISHDKEYAIAFAVIED